MSNATESLTETALLEDLLGDAMELSIADVKEALDCVGIAETLVDFDANLKDVEEALRALLREVASLRRRA